MLDHEDKFRTRQFMNTSILQLAECLLAYMGESDAVTLREAILAIDPPLYPRVLSGGTRCRDSFLKRISTRSYILFPSFITADTARL